MIGPNGKPDPSNSQVTQTPIPSLYDAVVLASKRPPVQTGHNTVGNQFYLFDSAHRLCDGPEETQRDLYSEKLPARCAAGAQVLKVNTGTVVIRGEKPDVTQKVPKNFNRGWFVIDDNPGVRTSLQALVEATGLAAETYASGREFLATYEDTGEATRSQYWMLVVMVGFTSLGLWLLSAVNR